MVVCEPVRVMVVDDSAAFRAGARVVLGLHDAVEIVAEAASGSEALDLLANTPTDVVLLDVNMVPMNGIETAERILSRWPGQRILLCSARPRHELGPLPESRNLTFLMKELLDADAVVDWARRS
jgi:DNA-binding NarL/FixJ family response regulator